MKTKHCFIFRYNRLKPIFSTLNDQIKQQEVACLSTARHAILQLPDKTVDLGTRYCLCFLNLSAQVKRFLRTLQLAFQGYLKKRGVGVSITLAALTQKHKEHVCRGRRCIFSYSLFSHYNPTVTDWNENSKNFRQPLALCRMSCPVKPTGDICLFAL